MGAFFAKLLGDDSSVVLDFEKAPDGDSKALYDAVAHDLQQAGPLLAELEGYAGCAALIQKALSQATKDNEDAAFTKVRECAIMCQKFHTFAKVLEGHLPALLRVLAAADKEQDHQGLIRHTALARQIAEILDFALKFDEIKMGKSVVQNDFSFYRRNMNKRAADELPINDEDANMISLFLASAIPVMTVFVNCVRNEAAQNAAVLPVLANIANACAAMVANKAVPPARVTFCLRCVAGCIVLFDHADPMGAFRKKISHPHGTLLQGVGRCQIGPQRSGRSQCCSVFNQALRRRRHARRNQGVV